MHMIVRYGTAIALLLVQYQCFNQRKIFWGVCRGRLKSKRSPTDILPNKCVQGEGATVFIVVEVTKYDKL